MLWNYSRKFFKKKGKDLHKYVSPLQEFTFTCQNILRFGQEEHPEGEGYSMYNYFNQSSLIQVILGDKNKCKTCSKNEECFKEITYLGKQEDYEERIRKFKCKLME